MVEKSEAKSKIETKTGLNNTHKSLLAGASGALIAIFFVLGSFGVVRAMHGPGGRDGIRYGAPTMTQGVGEYRGMRGGPNLGGEITKIDNDTITLKGMDAQVITVTVNDKTTYHKADSDAKLSDLKVGDKVMIRGEVKTVTVDADSIGIRQ